MGAKLRPVMREFSSTARLDGRWWVVQCDQHPGALSQVNTLDGAEAVHAEAIGFVASIPQDTVNVTVRVIP
jgi:hypothetical protein